MARARKVPGIRPKGSLLANARRVLEVRLDEVLTWATFADDPDRVSELHDLRIAAKRLRYALEMLEVCFDSETVLKEVTATQEVLGDIHDLDVLITMLRARLQITDRVNEEQMVAAVSDQGTPRQRGACLQELLSAQAKASERVGLLGLLAGKIAERRHQYELFRERWGSAGLHELGERVRAVTAAPEDILDGVDVPRSATVSSNVGPDHKQTSEGIPAREDGDY